jgi:hypothetical protein
MVCWFWRRFLKMFSVFSLFCYYVPLEKGYPLCLNKLESPPPKDDLCPVWLNWPSGSGEVENVKVYRQTDRRQTSGDQKRSII